MDKYKITQNEINENNVKSAADLLKGEPRDNKNIFDRLPELIANKVNGFIDAVISKFTDYYNKTEIDGKENVLNEAINTKANADDVYTKAQTYTKEETNVAINEKVNELGAGDMAKAVYDTDGDGVVDDAEKLNGQPASYYATKAEVQAAQTTANNAMPKSGGTFTGAVTLKGDPTANLHPATKQYVDNKTGIDLLWTNASPTSSFAPQTINISTDGYKYFITACITDGANPTPIAFDVFIKNYEGEMRHIYTSSRFRSVKFTSGKATFKTGYVATGNGYSAENGIVIPLYIWGVK